jgi:dienelactone hydrolase
MIVPRVNPFTIHRHIALSNAMRRPRFDWKFAVSPKLKATEDIANVHVPVSLIHVKNDWLIDHTHSLALFERANEPRELHIIDIPGNYHADRIFLQASERIEPLVRRFLTDRLARDE